jgi:single-stranded-DNA-specific exonuclease
MNSERQTIERSVREEAEKQIDTEHRQSDTEHRLSVGQTHSPHRSSSDLPRVLILAGDDWHRGVLGLAAGRIAQKHHRPTLVMTKDGANWVGSARSIQSVNLHAQLDSVADLFTHFGGHEFACGFSLPADRLPELRRRLTASFDALDPEAFERTASIDAELAIGEINREFSAMHDLLEPFGAGNPQPIFVTRGAEVVGSRTFASDCWELTLASGGVRVPAVVWPSVRPLVDEMTSAGCVDVLFHVEADSYSPTGSRMVVVDARKAE